MHCDIIKEKGRKPYDEKADFLDPAFCGCHAAFPWLAVTFARSDAGMALTLLMLFAVDPAYCAAAGFFAGKQIRALWSVPLIASALFLAGTWMLFEMGEQAFLLYAGVYFVLGSAMMLLSWIVEKRRICDG